MIFLLLDQEWRSFKGVAINLDNRPFFEIWQTHGHLLF